MSAALKYQVDFIERGGRTLRMHTVPTLHAQNVADHSYGVAWWCHLLSPGGASANLLLAALQHDTAEAYTGDIPSPTKRELGIKPQVDAMEARFMEAAYLPDFQKLLTPAETRTLQVADLLELLQHCVRERSLGNRTARLKEMYDNVLAYLAETVRLPIELSALNIVVEKWNAYD